MLADTTSANEPQPVTVEEGYARAAGASSLKMEWHRTSSVDMVAAAGMNPHRMGLALMRLRTEWDKSAKPEPMSSAQIEDMAAKLVKEPPDSPHAGLVREDVDGETRYSLPLELAKSRAYEWHLHELGILLQGLKTLPTVRAGLIDWMRRPDAQHVVAPVLLWWLEPKCPTCKGSGVRVVAGTGGRSSGKACPDCKSSSVPGDRKIPHAGNGRKLVSYLNQCCRAAARDLREGASRVLRSKKNQEQREEISEYERDEQEARAVTTDRRDDITRGAVAEVARTATRGVKP